MLDVQLISTPSRFPERVRWVSMSRNQKADFFCLRRVRLPFSIETTRPGAWDATFGLLDAVVRAGDAVGQRSLPCLLVEGTDWLAADLTSRRAHRDERNLAGPEEGVQPALGLQVRGN